MKNLLLIIAICLFFFSSCTKKNEVTPEPNRAAIVEGDYKMTSIKDATGTIDLTNEKDGSSGIVSFKRIV